jgi:hypothetical protein
MSTRALSSARSALPDAPVVVTGERHRRATVRTRAALAASMRRLADAVAPPPATVCD